MTKLDQIKRIVQFAAISAGQKPKVFAENIMYKVERNGVESIRDGFGLSDSEASAVIQVLNQ